MNTPAQAELGRGTPKTYKMVRVGQPPPFHAIQPGFHIIASCHPYQLTMPGGH
jgi:hypothetical protein